MKYAASSVSLSLEERAANNHRIVNLLLSGNTRDLTPQVVFDEFTGKGRLHHLDFKEFSSRHAFSDAKKEIELGQFFTPNALCQKIVEAVQPPPHFKIADITCGMGNLFNHLPDESKCYGNELDEDAFEVCRYLYPKAHLENKDFLEYKPGIAMDMIIGNPPFNLHTAEGSSQFAFVKKSHELLTHGGFLVFIVPSSFLADDFQDKQKIDWINARFNFVTQAPLPSRSFDAHIDTKLVILQKKGITNSHLPYQPTSHIDFNPEEIYNTLVEPLLDQYDKDRFKRKLHARRTRFAGMDYDYAFRRRLWHLKENPDLHRKHYEKALKEIETLNTQQKPKDMPEDEWEKIKLTPEKVLVYLNTLVKNQNKKPGRRVVKLVKTQYGMKAKAYSDALKDQEKILSIHAILKDPARYNLGNYGRHFRKKKKELELQNIPWVDLPRNARVDAYLDNVILEPAFVPGLLFQPDDIPTIVPNQMQKNDLGLVLQKRYAQLAWEQGSGKSVAGMIWLKYHQAHYKNCFIVGPAIAIGGTWTGLMKNYGFPFTVLESITDVEKIKPGQIVLASFDRLVELERHIKKHVRRCSHKIALIVDESDELTNHSSKRTRATLNAFRRCRYKLLTTGTVTRNTINEFYPQLELLYNNSTAQLCLADTCYRVDEEGTLQLDNNPHYCRPFPPRYGNAVFRSCFCPMKSTVFGIQKDNQDIYNEVALKELIDKTVITRKFEEIAGDKKHSLHMHQVEQKAPEKTLYHTLMNEFMRVCYDYYTSTGNSRKEAGLRLVRQMQILIKATSIPHTLKNYAGTEKPAKFEAVRDLIVQWPNELVAIGVTSRKCARSYVKYLGSAFPTRELFLINGEMEVEARKEVLNRFKISRNGILVCTQQSLKSSINIPYCNKVIVESLQWNIPRIAQFYFRFIRYDSTRHTEVHFVNYKNTIELNLLALLMAKERLNDFMKTTNRTTTDAIYKEFGVDICILDMLIQRNYDEDGKLYLTWGQQRLVA